MSASFAPEWSTRRVIRRSAALGDADVRAGMRGDLAVALRLRLQVEVVGRRDTSLGILPGGAKGAAPLPSPISEGCGTLPPTRG
jgi:hypothetical protein